jgi:uncharacterized protein YecT (DUF1311 family)
MCDICKYDKKIAIEYGEIIVCSRCEEHISKDDMNLIKLYNNMFSILDRSLERIYNSNSEDYINLFEEAFDLKKTQLSWIKKINNRIDIIRTNIALSKLNQELKHKGKGKTPFVKVV